MEMLKGTKCAGKVHYISSRHVPVMQHSSAQCGQEEQHLWDLETWRADGRGSAEQKPNS